MKLTPNAFEALYQRCDPESRKDFFKGLAAYIPPVAATCHVSVPVSRIEQALIGYSGIQVKLVAVERGEWEVA